METRVINSRPFAVRADEGGEMKISGKFISFTDEYQICSDGIEVVSPDLKIEGDDVRALIDHKSRYVLGRTTAKTLTLVTKEDGVYADISINPKDTDATNLYARVERGDVSQCSFGFDILDEETEVIDGICKWTIKAIKLYEVSVVTFPAYQDTHVEARAAQIEDMKKREMDAWKKQMMSKIKGE